MSSVFFFFRDAVHEKMPSESVYLRVWLRLKGILIATTGYRKMEKDTKRGKFAKKISIAVQILTLMTMFANN